MSSCFDAPKWAIGTYHHLPEELVADWSTHQTELSYAYLTRKIPGASANPESAKRKANMLAAIKAAYEDHGNPEDFAKVEELLSKNLEDPGTLLHTEYFDVPNSDEMINFFVNIWSGKMAEVMEALHGHGKDLKGNYRTPPADEAWARMITYEGIAINERIKAQSVADTIYDEDSQSICFFGGGNIPERHYDDCLCDCKVINFETGATGSPEELFPEAGATDVRFFATNLLQSKKEHPELISTQDLVVMHGVSMYLGKDIIDNMIIAVDNAKELLGIHGVMMFDYLLMTEGMKRTATAQHWPHADKMKIFESPDDAVAEARRVVAAVNASASTAVMEIEKIAVTLVEPWGPTSVRFWLRKYM